MATTTNYAWTTPDDSSLVKDGASAIRALGTAIDTSMNTALGTKKAGMVLLNTTSFSAVASQSINDVFSATYDSYIIYYNITSSSATGALTFRLRVSGADNSSNNYAYNEISKTSANSTVSGYGTNALVSSWDFGYKYSGPTMSLMEIFNPFSAVLTTAQHDSFETDGTGAGVVTRHHACSTSVTTSYTGFTVAIGSGTMTGSVSVFGVNK